MVVKYVHLYSFILKLLINIMSSIFQIIIFKAIFGIVIGQL